MKYTKLIALIIFTPIFLTACAGTGRYGAGDYKGSEVRRVERVKTGTIINIATNIRITDKNNNLGAIAGGTAGAIAGSALGDGRGQLLLGLGGLILGGVAGDAIETHANTSEGVRITVKLTNGEVLAITQSADVDSKSLRVGDTVNVYDNLGTLRVAR